MKLLWCVALAATLSAQTFSGAKATDDVITQAIAQKRLPGAVLVVGNTKDGGLDAAVLPASPGNDRPDPLVEIIPGDFGDDLHPCDRAGNRGAAGRSRCQGRRSCVRPAQSAHSPQHEPGAGRTGGARGSAG